MHHHTENESSRCLCLFLCSFSVSVSVWCLWSCCCGVCGAWCVAHPVCTGHHAHVSNSARGASTHGDVLSGHTQGRRGGLSSASCFLPVKNCDFDHSWASSPDVGSISYRQFSARSSPKVTSGSYLFWEWSEDNTFHALSNSTLNHWTLRSCPLL